MVKRRGPRARPMRALLLAVPLALLAGCAAPAAPPPAADATPEVAWPQLLLDVASGPHQQSDVLCAFGGAAPFDRAEGRVLEGARHVMVALELSGAWTGMQPGYAVDDGPVTWLGPPMTSGRAEWDVPVEPEQVEAATGAPRWLFYLQGNVPEGAAPCYTGGGAGEFTLAAEARP